MFPASFQKTETLVMENYCPYVGPNRKVNLSLISYILDFSFFMSQDDAYFHIHQNDPSVLVYLNLVVYVLNTCVPSPSTAYSVLSQVIHITRGCTISDIICPHSVHVIRCRDAIQFVNMNIEYIFIFTSIHLYILLEKNLQASRGKI